MFGFVKTSEKLKEIGVVNFRKEKQKRERIFTILFGIFGFIILNLILYMMTRF